MTQHPTSSTSSPGCPKAELHVHHVGSASPRIVSELAARHPGAVPSDPEALARVLRLPRLRPLHRGLPRRRRPDPHPGGRAPADLRGGPRDGRRPAGAVRRADRHPAHLRARRRTDRGLHRGDRGRTRRGRARPRHRAALDLRRPGRVRRAGGRRHAGLRPRPRARGPDRLRTRRPRGRRAAAAVPAPTSTPPAPPGCTASRTQERRPGRRPCGTHCASSGAERIGHGTSSAQDPDLLAHLAEHRIPLEVCPSSNLATRAVATLEEHPLPVFVEAGVVVTINSDDPPMFGTTLNREYADRRRAARPGRSRGGRPRPRRRPSVVRAPTRSARECSRRSMPTPAGEPGAAAGETCVGPAVSYSAGPDPLYDRGFGLPRIDTLAP